MTDCVQVSTTIDSETRARELARRLVEERLAACVQIAGPLASTYRWEGRVEEATEWLLLIKTTAAAVEQLSGRIRALHSYTQPEIIATPITAGDPRYLEWIAAEVAG
ncbi:MAG: divalent-cation tolerance protein CutA [Gemmatimonadota bacterium]